MFVLGLFITNVQEVYAQSDDLSNSDEQVHDIGIFFNPSSGIIQLKYRLSETADVSLEIYSILGELVLTVVEASQGPGQYSYSFDKSKLAQSSGLYIVKFNVDGMAYTRRLGYY